MDGFINQAEAIAARNRPACLQSPYDPHCGAAPDTMMGYRDGRDIPNYWAYARNFVLQDHMFEPNLGWSLPSHLFMVSGWSAKCANPLRVGTCRGDLEEDQDTDRTPWGTEAHPCWPGGRSYLLYLRLPP